MLRSRLYYYLANMGSETSKVDLNIAEQGIRARIDRIDSIILNKNFIYNTLNHTLNYIDEFGNSMLNSRLIPPRDLVILTNSMYAMIQSIHQDQYVIVTRKCLHNILNQYLNKDEFNDV